MPMRGSHVRIPADRRIKSLWSMDSMGPSPSSDRSAADDSDVSGRIEILSPTRFRSNVDRRCDSCSLGQHRFRLCCWSSCGLGGGFSEVRISAGEVWPPPVHHGNGSDSGSMSVPRNSSIASAAKLLGDWSIMGRSLRFPLLATSRD
jgi:hypothetical protein